MTAKSFAKQNLSDLSMNDREHLVLASDRIKGIVYGVMLVTGLILAVIWAFHNSHRSSSRFASTPMIGDKPVLGYFAFTASLVESLEREQILSVEQMVLFQEIAREEQEALRALEKDSETIIQSDWLALSEKRAAIGALAYNQRVREITDISFNKLQNQIDPGRYALLNGYLEEKWLSEQQIHGGLKNTASPRSYSIFATRYDSGGRYTVALPDKCLKFSNAGNHVCDEDGYVVNQNYSVYLSYKSGVAATIGESGPWNVDDNYWAGAGDPQPRRMFRDLATGMPEAQAAYFNGYNGGLDQFGRKVTAPFGIDLARQVSIDIGLQPGVNDWINISFMWTADWGNGTSKGADGEGEGEPAEVVKPILVATPRPDGRIIHIVEEGQTLWNIAAAYEISLTDLLVMNGLTKDSIIFPGEELVVRDESTEVIMTTTPVIQDTGIFTETQTSALVSSTIQPYLETKTAYPTSSKPIDVDEETVNVSSWKGGNSQNNPVLIGIVITFIMGVCLLMYGLLFNKPQ